MLSKDRCCSRTTRSISNEGMRFALPFPSLPLHQTQKFVPQLRFTNSKDCSSFRLSAQPNARFVPQPRLLSYSKDRSSSGPSRPLCADLFGSPSKLHACMHGGRAWCHAVSQTAAEGAPGTARELRGERRWGARCMGWERRGNRTRGNSTLELVGPSHVAHTRGGEGRFCRVAGSGYLRMGG